MTNGNVRTIRRPNDQYVMIPNAFARDPKIPKSAFRVAVFIMSHNTAWQVSQDSVARALDMTAGTVAKALKDLEGLGYAHRTPVFDHTGRRPDIILISCERLTPEEWVAETADTTPTSKSPDGETLDGKTEVRKKTNSKKTNLEEDQNNTSSPEGDGALFPAPEPPATTPAGGPESPTVNRVLDEQFDAWWPLYPRKVGKDAARRAYRAARRRGAAEGKLTAAITEQAARYRVSKTEARFIPHAATWLNGGRYDDVLDDAVPKASAGGTGTVAPVSDWENVDPEEEAAVWGQWGKRDWT